MVLAPGAINLVRDIDLRSTQRPGRIMVDLIEESPERTALEEPHGKGPVEPEAPWPDGGATV